MKVSALKRILALALIGIAGSAVASAQLITINGTLRDFSIAPTKLNPDFENIVDGSVITGIVSSTLGADGKPVYAHAGAFASVSGASSFNQWYNNTAGVNVPFSTSLTLHDDGTTGDATAGDGVYTLVAPSYFPLDGIGFGNEGQTHNYGFTLELHTSFGFDSSRANNFTFSGDDDIWVFINDKLVIDLGGVHTAASQTIDVNSLAASLGLVSGSNYNLDIFYAERHTTLSELEIETTLPLARNPVPEPSTYGLIGAGLLGAAVIVRRRRAARA